MLVKAYKHAGHRVKIEQTKVKRDWMDATDNAHAYKCFPVSLANTIGWSISLLDDVEFIWDGISDSSSEHVKVLKDPAGACSTQRSNGTISFYTGIFFETDKDTTMLQIVPPNYFIDGAAPFTTLISTSFFPEAIPVAWKITRPNTVITIPAGTPIATFIPISLAKYNEVELEIQDKVWPELSWKQKEERNKVWQEITMQGKFTNFYRDGVEYDGTKIGDHELKAIRLKINDFSTKIEE